MKKILVFAGLAVLFLAVSASFSWAQEATSAETDNSSGAIVETEVTAQDLGVANPGLLPTSPFYFLKNWKRGIQRALTFNAVKKAELELDIANEQAAELKKLEEVAPNRVDAIAKAAANYQANVDRLKSRLEALKETSQNPNIDKLMEKLSDRAIKHQQLFDDLKKKFENQAELKQRFEMTQEKINETIAKIPEKFDSPEIFKKRIERALEARPNGGLKELRSIEILERIKEKLPAERRSDLESVKENLIQEFEDKISAMPEETQRTFMLPHILEKLPGNPARHLKIIGELKDRILDQAVESGNINKEKASEQIKNAAEMIENISKKISELEEIKTAAELSEIKEMAREAKNHLDIAREALSEDKYGQAFGQAISAGSLAENALRQLVKLPADSPRDDESVTSDEIVCTQEYAPVCGANGKTYSNRCHAKKAGIAVRAEGVCR